MNDEDRIFVDDVGGDVVVGGFGGGGVFGVVIGVGIML